MHALSRMHSLRVELRIGLPALTFPCRLTDAFPSPLELRYEPRLLILRKRSRNLSHHDARRIAGIRQVIPIGGQYPHVPFDRQEHPKLLGDKITSKPACVLDYDRLDAVAF